MKDVTVVWDWNGTLLNDVELNCAIMNRMLLERGKKPLPDLETYRRIFGFPIKGYYERAGFDFSREPYESVADEYLSLYQPASMECRLFEGAREVMDSLDRKGVRQVVLSASQEDCLVEQLRNLHVKEKFDEVLALDHCLAYSKAALAEEWMTKNRLSGENLLLIGDTLHDYEVAARLNAPCLLVAAGHQDKERLLSCGSPVLSDIREVGSWIQNQI